jgi:hypothetical protein
MPLEISSSQQKVLSIIGKIFTGLGEEKKKIGVVLK